MKKILLFVLKRSSYLVLLFLFSASFSWGQITVTNTPLNTNGSPAWLTQFVIANPAVVTSASNFVGDANQIGRFYGPSNIGLNDGVVLSTADIANIPGGILGSLGQVSLSTVLDHSDIDLITLSSNPDLHDAAVLEFDFIADGDSVVFRYVFASEEYPEYVCSDFNDVFGFFLSGPGIAGPYSNGAVNIAKIPNTNTVVAINTVNGGVSGLNGMASNCANIDPNWTTYSSYFVDNENNLSSTSVVFDGFTVPLIAKYGGLQCGMKYHIKIALADVGDQWYDSGVFLEKGSFNSSGITYVFIDPANSADPLINLGTDTIAEGCDDGKVLIYRTSDLGNYTAHFTVSGNAINSLDYTPIADSITFPDGVDSLYVNIHAFADGISEGTEFIKFNIMNINFCGDTLYDSVIVKIIDEYQINVLDLGSGGCQNDSISVTASTTSAYQPISYLWENGDTTTFSTLVLSASSFYNVTVTDKFGCLKSDSIYITISSPPILITPIDTSVCAGSTILLSGLLAPGSASGGVWSGNYVNGLIYQAPNYEDTSQVKYTVQNGFCVDSAIINVIVYPLVNATWNPIDVCSTVGNINLNTLLTVNSTLGGTWLAPNISGSNLPIQNNDYSIAVTYVVSNSFCSDFKVDTIHVFENVDASWTPNVSFCSSEDSIDLKPLVLPTSTQGGTWTGNNAPNGYLVPSSAITTFAITYYVNNGSCRDSALHIVTTVKKDSANFQADNFCENAPNQFTVLGNPGLFSFSPLPTDGAFINPYSGIISNPTAHAQYNVRLITSSVCPDTMLKTVEVYEAPTASISGGGDLCSMAIVPVDVAFTSAAPWGITYLYNSDTISINNIVSNPYSLTAEHQGTISLLEVSNQHCQANPNGSVSITSDDLSFNLYGEEGCQPLTIQLNNLSMVSPNATCTWTIGDFEQIIGCNNKGYVIYDAGIYDLTLEITSAKGCTGTKTLVNAINAFENPIASFNQFPHDVTNLHNKVFFDNTSQFANEYIWTINNNSYDQVNIMVPLETYDDFYVCLKAENEHCEHTFCDTIEVTIIPTFFIPTAFTPGATNGINDVFIPKTTYISENGYDFSVFNRWGDLIFNTKKLNEGWDGTFKGQVSPFDVYTWKIQYVTIPDSKTTEVMYGRVTLVK